MITGVAYNMGPENERIEIFRSGPEIQSSEYPRQYKKLNLVYQDLTSVQKTISNWVDFYKPPN